MKADQIRKEVEKREGKLRKIKIDEWGLEVFYIPITINDEQELKLTSEFTDDETNAVNVVFHKAWDEDGNRIWTTEEHREFIRTKIRSKVLNKLIKAIFGDDVEEAKKNFKKTRS